MFWYYEPNNREIHREIHGFPGSTRIKPIPMYTFFHLVRLTPRARLFAVSLDFPVLWREFGQPPQKTKFVDPQNECSQNERYSGTE